VANKTRRIKSTTQHSGASAWTTCRGASLCALQHYYGPT